MERRGRLLQVPLLMLAGFCVLAGRSACFCVGMEITLMAAALCHLV